MPFVRYMIEEKKDVSDDEVKKIYQMLDVYVDKFGEYVQEDKKSKLDFPIFKRLGRVILIDRENIHVISSLDDFSDKIIFIKKSSEKFSHKIASYLVYKNFGYAKTNVFGLSTEWLKQGIELIKGKIESLAKESYCQENKYGGFLTKFQRVCPLNYPNSCNLPKREVDELLGPEKYKMFFMYQFEANKSTREVIYSNFKPPDFKIYDAQVAAGLNVKLCKICKLLLASDFGIADITPLNWNVFLEIGFIFGLQKPLIILVNRKIKSAKELPFDVSHNVVIEYESKQELHDGLARELPLFLSKVILK